MIHDKKFIVWHYMPYEGHLPFEFATWEQVCTFIQNLKPQHDKQFDIKYKNWLAGRADTIDLTGGERIFVTGPRLTGKDR